MIMIIILKNRIDRCPDQHPDVPKGSRLRRAGAARDGALDGKGAKSCDGFSGPHIDSCGAATAAVRSAKRSAKLSANGQRTVSELSANCQRTVSELSANGQRTVSEAVSEADRSLVGRFSDRPLVSCSRTALTVAASLTVRRPRAGWRGVADLDPPSAGRARAHFSQREMARRHQNAVTWQRRDSMTP